MTIALIIISILFSAFSGFAKSICDLSEDRKLFMLSQKNPFFWIKAYSWRNKWKTDNTGNLIKVNGAYVERFFGSSRWFVSVTDAWHLFGLLERLSFVVTYCSVGYLISQSNWYWFMLLSYPFSMLVFHLFYNSKILKS